MCPQYFYRLRIMCFYRGDVMYQNIMRQLRRQKIRRFIAYAAAVFIPIALIIGLFIRINSQVDLLADGGYDEVYYKKDPR